MPSRGAGCNVRAVGTPDVGPGLRQGLEALEHSAVAIRGMFRSLVDAAHDPTWPHDDTTEDVLLGLAQTFREMAAVIDAFGQLVHDEAGPATRVSSPDVLVLREALEGLQEARARLDDLLMAGTTPVLLELHAAVLSTVKRLLREMDVAERIRRQVRMLRTSRPRPSVPHAPTPTATRPPTSLEATPDAETQVLPRIPGDGSDRRRT